MKRTANILAARESVHPVLIKMGRKRKISLASNENFWAYVFLAPIIIGFLAFTIFPVIMSFYYGLTSYDGITSPKFVGIGNYIELASDENFLKSLWNTVYFTLGTVPVGAFLALIVAVGLNAKIHFVNLYRTAFFIPVVVSTVAVSMVWQWMYNQDYGLINLFLGKLGLYQPPWLASTSWSMPSVIIMSIWKGLGFNAVILLAGIQGISPSLYEAAEIDGASGIQKFWHITVPMIHECMAFVLINGLIGSFQTFDQIYVMTNGGPAQSTQVISWLIYMNAFRYFKQGYASAMAYILFLIIFIASILQLHLSEKKNY